MATRKKYKVGLVDADLLCNGTRHPNLALLKLAGYFRDNGFYRLREGLEIINGSTYELITNECNFIDLHSFDHIYVSCVFSFTLDSPPEVLRYLMTTASLKKKVHMGGTGSYANLPVDGGFLEAREEDMHRLENDKFLLRFKDKKTKLKGINMRTQMPDYHLYDEYVGVMEAIKKSPNYYKDYKQYSIGFLTRGCFRRCPFCVNKLERKAVPYSNLEDFLDNETDENGKLVRPYIYLWDDNFLASPHWDRLLDELIATGRPFQFRQGLDERLLAQNKNGEKMAAKLAKANYHGDFIFAFDNWFDRNLIVKALKIWKYHCPKKETKFYLFCGFQQTPDNDKKFQLDIAEIFMRISVLMRYGCLGYIMRHEDYHKAPLPNIYVQIARWCNQPGFYRNLSFWQFCYKNQTYWEEHTLGIKHDRLKTYEEFIEDYENGYYNEVTMTTPLKSVFNFLNKFKEHKKLFLSFFNLSFKEMIDSTLWERDTEITIDDTKYVMDKEYWNNLLGNPTNERVLLKAFYTHADDSLLENEEKSKVLLEVLKKYKCSEILELIGHEFTPYPITKADPSQFSDFKDAYYSVPFLLANCGKTDVDYNQMGYMLRSEKRKEVADKKYGENHMKTAAQLGLCRFAKCRANANALGSNFVKLNERDMKAVLPKLCLYIPYIQNYFMAGATDEVREEILSILSKTTQTRRRPNVNLIIETVKDSIEYEL